MCKVKLFDQSTVLHVNSSLKPLLKEMITGWSNTHIVVLASGTTNSISEILHMSLFVYGPAYILTIHDWCISTPLGSLEAKAVTYIDYKCSAHACTLAHTSIWPYCITQLLENIFNCSPFLYHACNPSSTSLTSTVPCSSPNLSCPPPLPQPDTAPAAPTRRQHIIALS